jgi:hypothetical protein
MTVSWEAKNQRTVALSSTEAEHMALSDGAKEALYLQNLLAELGLKTAPVDLFNDNQGAQELVRNPVHHSRTKHIDTRFLGKSSIENELVQNLVYLLPSR